MVAGIYGMNFDNIPASQSWSSTMATSSPWPGWRCSACCS